MTNCCRSFFRGTWSFLIGSLRIILIFLCLIFTLSCSMALFVVIRNELNQVDPTMPKPDTRGCLMLVGGIILGIIGAHGSIYKRHPIIRIFSLLTGLSFLLFAATTYHQDSVSERATWELFKNLRGEMPYYSWDQKFKSERSINATQSWDNMQKLNCCGVDGPSDWIKYRPSGSKYEDAYPSSCCSHSHGGACTKHDDIPTYGCHKIYRSKQVLVMVVELIGAFYLFVLSVISYMVGCCSLDSHRQPRHTAGIVFPRGQDIHLDQQQYQQAPSSQQGSPSAPRQSLAPTYPNLHGSSNNYSVAPPSYGT